MGVKGNERVNHLPKTMQRRNMKEETRNATIRLPQSLADWLTRNGDSINQAVIDTAEELRAIKLVSLSELKGLLTPNEWCFLADSFNGAIVSNSLRYNFQTLVAHVEDSALYGKLDEKWGVNMDVLKEKLLPLRGANVDALYGRIESFWNDGNISMEDWSKF